VGCHSGADHGGDQRNGFYICPEGQSLTLGFPQNILQAKCGQAVTDNLAVVEMKLMCER